MKYDLYDFDKTVFPFDSETCFLFFCILRRPWLILLTPYLLVRLVLFFAGFGDKHKGGCFAFLRFIDSEKMTAKFWAKNEKRIYPLFKPENRERPVVVCSASPEFLLRGICEKYGVDTLVATRMNPVTGKIDGANCKNAEKVRRLSQALPNAQYVNVFSDSIKSDVHIFALGERCFYTRGGKPCEMPFQEIQRRAQKVSK